MSKFCGDCGTLMQDGQKYCHECSAANEWGNSESAPTLMDTAENEALSPLEEQQESNDTPLPQEQPAQPQQGNLCTRCQAPVKDGQSRCDKCTEELLNEALDSTEPEKFTGYVVPLFNTWKTSVPFSILGLVIGFPLFLIVSTLIGYIVVGMPISIIFGRGTTPSSYVPFVVIVGTAIRIFYAAKVYPSFFTKKPMLKSSNTISFANFMMGGVIFGCLWNGNLTKREKGISYIVFWVLDALYLAFMTFSVVAVLFAGLAR